VALAEAPEGADFLRMVVAAVVIRAAVAAQLEGADVSCRFGMNPEYGRIVYFSHGYS
jgi:hypothetical protein